MQHPSFSGRSLLGQMPGADQPEQPAGPNRAQRRAAAKARKSNARRATRRYARALEAEARALGIDPHAIDAEEADDAG